MSAVLVLQLVGAVFTLFTLPQTYQVIQQRAPNKSGLATGLFLLGELILIPSVIALYRWRRWGFYGILTVSLLALAVNLWDGRGIVSVSGLLGVVLVYIALRVGGHSAAWYYLSPGGRAGAVPPPEQPQEGVWPPPPTRPDV